MIIPLLQGNFLQERDTDLTQELEDSGLLHFWCFSKEGVCREKKITMEKLGAFQSTNTKVSREGGKRKFQMS